MRVSSIPILSVVFLLTSCGYLDDGRGVITVKSEFVEPLSSIVVEVEGISSIKAGPLDPRSELTLEFTVPHDSSYIVEVEFSSGRKMSKAFGYVTHGINSQHVVVVEETGIEVVESSYSLPPRRYAPLPNSPSKS